MSPEPDGTLDLTKIRMTPVQLFFIISLISGAIATSTISLYQLTEVRRAQVESAAIWQAMDTRVHILETDKARREGIEYGQTHPNEKGAP